MPVKTLWPFRGFGMFYPRGSYQLLHRYGGVRVVGVVSNVMRGARVCGGRVCLSAPIE